MIEQLTTIAATTTQTDPQVSLHMIRDAFQRRGIDSLVTLVELGFCITNVSFLRAWRDKPSDYAMKELVRANTQENTYATY